MNENAIIFYDYYMEIWIKNKGNIFVKNKTISIGITSNILINSKSSLLLYAEYDGILVLQIKENIPQNIITNIKMQYNKTNLFFINNEELLGVHLFHNCCSYIYFFQMKDFTIVKKMNITEKAGEDSSYEIPYISKINENRIFYIYSKPYKNKTFFLTIKIPEFVFEQKRKKKIFFSNFAIYKNYIIFYNWNKKIMVFENSKCNLVRVIYTKGFSSMIHLKDNYLLGSKGEIFSKILVVFKLNI
jgi:hypothetical protein